MKPLTLEQAKQLQYGDTLYHISKRYPRTKDPLRVKVQGKPHTWKTRPNDVLITVKYGLYEYFYISEHDLDKWSKEE